MYIQMIHIDGLIYHAEHNKPVLQTQIKPSPWLKSILNGDYPYKTQFSPGLRLICADTMFELLIPVAFPTEYSNLIILIKINKCDQFENSEGKMFLFLIFK